MDFILNMHMILGFLLHIKHLRLCVIVFYSTLYHYILPIFYYICCSFVTRESHE